MMQSPINPFYNPIIQPFNPFIIPPFYNQYMNIPANYN